MSLHQLTDITRQLGSDWKCGAIDHPPGGRCKLWLGPQDLHDPFSELLVITAPSLPAAVAAATHWTQMHTPQEITLMEPTLYNQVLFNDRQVTAIVSINGA